MESITIKVDAALAREMDRAMKPYYSTKTEFIREAIRDKIKEARREERRQMLNKYLGISNTQTSDEELEEIREKAFKELMKKRRLKLE